VDDPLNEILIWEFKNLHNFARPWGALPAASCSRG